MRELDWSYIAGFFDWEGCIHINKAGNRGCKGSLICNISQTKKEGELVLRDIEAFLRVNGIVCRVGVQLRSKVQGHADCWRLWINGWENCVRFLNFIFPYLRVKRTLAQDVTRYPKAFPYFTSKIRGMLHVEGWKANRAGLR